MELHLPRQVCHHDIYRNNIKFVEHSFNPVPANLEILHTHTHKPNLTKPNLT